MGNRKRFLQVWTLGLLLSIPLSTSHSQESAKAPPRVQALQKSLKASLATIIASRQAALGPETKIGVSIADAATGTVLFEHNAGETFAAASNAKLITTAAALERLGPDFQFRTELLADTVDPTGTIVGNLYIRGRGNPSFHESDLMVLAERLKAQGIVRVDGAISVDNSYFDGRNLPPHFEEQPEETASFRAPIAATSLAFNATTLVVRPAFSGSGPVRIQVSPPNDYVKVVNKATTVADGRSHLRMKTEETKSNLVIHLDGVLRREVKKRRFRKRIPDPVPFVGTAVRRALKQVGISVRKTAIQRRPAPKDAVPVATHYSLPLAVAIRGMGKYSK